MLCLESHQDLLHCMHTNRVLRRIIIERQIWAKRMQRFILTLGPSLLLVPFSREETAKWRNLIVQNGPLDFGNNGIQVLEACFHYAFRSVLVPRDAILMRACAKLGSDDTISVQVFLPIGQHKSLDIFRGVSFLPNIEEFFIVGTSSSHVRFLGSSSIRGGGPNHSNKRAPFCVSLRNMTFEVSEDDVAIHVEGPNVALFLENVVFSSSRTAISVDSKGTVFLHSCKFQNVQKALALIHGKCRLKACQFPDNTKQWFSVSIRSILKCDEDGA